MTKRIMRRFRIDEISGVGTPAQEHAKVALMKSHTSTGVRFSLEGDTWTARSIDKVEAYAKSAGRTILTSEDSGHQHSVTVWRWNEDLDMWLDRASGTTKDGEHNHSVVVKADEEGKLVISLSKNYGHTHSVDMAEVNAILEKIRTERIERITRELTAKEEKEMTEKTEKAAPADQPKVIYKSLDGTEYTDKDDSRLVNMAKQNDEMQKALNATREIAENARLEKAALADIPNLAGDNATKTRLYKSIEKIDDEGERKAVIDMLKAADAAVASLSTNKGQKAGETGGSGSNLSALIKSHMDKHSVSEAKATVAVLGTPEGAAAYAAELHAA